ncbi:hypothetical protein [Luteolibacter marinus]|uniref:hypothetical protein n=1 Tax=Luteolibacter marinus TaxID=2776705 RepID=UPI0018670585|nr:hypothetical protein [Luteolibacter marinus]
MAKKSTPTRQSKLALQGESTGPNWDRARHILAGIKTCIRLGLAGQVLLGQELLALKIDLGFTRGGDRRSNPHDAGLKSLNRTWEDWCKSELGISDDTAARFIACHEAAKLRVKKLGGQPRLLILLETPPGQLSEENHTILAGMVDKLVDGESQKDLLEELKIAKQHKALTGGANPAPAKPTENQAAEQLAFAFFSKVPDTVAKIQKGVTGLMTAPDYKAYLYRLPVSGDGGLESLAASLEEAIAGDLSRMLADVKEAIASKLQSIAAA